MPFRLLPPSSEGFRRISIVLAIVTFIGVVGKCANVDAKEREGLTNMFTDTYLSRQDHCKQDYPDPQACIAEAKKFETDSITIAYGTREQNLQRWGLYAILGSLSTYVVALCVRTLGWIALGFGKRAQS